MKSWAEVAASDSLKWATQTRSTCNAASASSLSRSSRPSVKSTGEGVSDATSGRVASWASAEIASVLLGAYALLFGRITYDGVGNMTAQGMPKDLPERAAQSSENVRGGFAYWGDVVYDVDNNIVIHKVKGSPSRGSWPGEDNIRYYEFDDGLLKLSMKDETGRLTGTLTWRKLTE